MEHKKKTVKEGADGLIENSLKQLMYGTIRPAREKPPEETEAEPTPEGVENTPTSISNNQS